MRSTLGLSLAASLLAAPALAWSEHPRHYNGTQPPSYTVPIWTYPHTVNYCPGGLQPVLVGTTISCGVPTHSGYPAPRSAPRHYRAQPAQEPFIAYSKDYMGN